MTGIERFGVNGVRFDLKLGIMNMVETAVLTLADTSFITATKLWMDIFAL